MRLIRCWIAILLFVLFLSSGAGARVQKGIPDDVTESLHGTFGDSVKIESLRILLSDSEKVAIGKISNSPFADDTLRVFTCRSADSVTGYGISDNVMGKSRFITYLLMLGPTGEVTGLDILVYRESHGGEISNSAFRRQFVGHRPGEPLAPGRDIKTISGATISSRAITAGVSKLLAAFALVSGRLR